jgi:MFS transporter, CP family, cyanate transporter
VPNRVNHPHRWWMLAGLSAVYASFGMVSGSLAPVLTRVRDDLGASESALGLALGAWQFVYLFTALPSGRLLDRIGLRRGVLVGGLVIAASALLRATAQGPVTLWLAVGLFGVGGPLVSIGAAKLVAGWFAAGERSKAVGIYSTAAPAGSMFSLLTAENIWIPLFGSWRWVLVAFAAVALLTVIGWWLISTSAPFAEIPMAEGDAAGGLSLLRDPAVRWVMVFTVGTFFIGHGLGNWLPTMLVEAGWSKSLSNLVVGLGVACGIVGSLTIPRRVRPERAARAQGWLLAATAATLMMVASSADVVRLVGVLSTGVVRFSLVPVGLLMLMATRSVSPDRMGAAGGLFFTAGEIGGVLGPYALGSLRESSGDFDSSLMLLVGLAATLAVLTLVARRWLQ